MNQLAPYEKIITQKIGQLAVPDRMDSIWENIEARLNTDLPVDTAPASGPAKSFLQSSKWFIILGTIIVITVLLVVKSRQKKNAENNLPGLQQKEQIIKDSNNATPPVNFNDEKIQSPKKDIAPVAIPDSPVNQPVPFILPDSATKINNQPIQLPDSKKTVVNPILPPLKKDSIPPDKKPKGVQGISDSDYKIKAAKKDST